MDRINKYISIINQNVTKTAERNETKNIENKLTVF